MYMLTLNKSDLIYFAHIFLLEVKIMLMIYASQIYSYLHLIIIQQMAAMGNRE